MVFPHRACGFAAGAAPIPEYGLDFFQLPLDATTGRHIGMVAAGLNPAANATLVTGSKAE